MNATVEVVCYKSKVLANGESPLMLRVTKDRKRKYSSIGISVNPVYWDFEKNKPRRNCPDKTRIEQIIAEQIRKYREQILDYQAEDKEFTPASLHDRVNNHAKNRTVGDLIPLPYRRPQIPKAIRLCPDIFGVVQFAHTVQRTP